MKALLAYTFVVLCLIASFAGIYYGMNNNNLIADYYFSALIALIPLSLWTSYSHLDEKEKREFDRMKSKYNRV